MRVFQGITSIMMLLFKLAHCPHSSDELETSGSRHLLQNRRKQKET